jgi:hypothetical protein
VVVAKVVVVAVEVMDGAVVVEEVEEVGAVVVVDVAVEVVVAVAVLAVDGVVVAVVVVVEVVVVVAVVVGGGAVMAAAVCFVAPFVADADYEFAMVLSVLLVAPGFYSYSQCLCPLHLVPMVVEDQICDPS